MNIINYANTNEKLSITSSNTNSNSGSHIDFYSILNTLQSALLQRQFEFQDWISNKFGVQNPTLKLVTVQYKLIIV